VLLDPESKWQADLAATDDANIGAYVPALPLGRHSDLQSLASGSQVAQVNMAAHLVSIREKAATISATSRALMVDGSILRTAPESNLANARIILVI
jgi:hypothetical protein